MAVVVVMMSYSVEVDDDRQEATSTARQDKEEEEEEEEEKEACQERPRLLPRGRTYENPEIWVGVEARAPLRGNISSAMPRGDVTFGDSGDWVRVGAQVKVLEGRGMGESAESSRGRPFGMLSRGDVTQRPWRAIRAKVTALHCQMYETPPFPPPWCQMQCLFR
ncbi:hypothetical protein E2C01_005842 [Portunus trituberculatus]|uniref:Uncharacterized protein n=1 Tax=Portunus trituberculatus TaxID=210409 RepID=A0A5B7CTQ7_PORTR|nr:hypothetical protein [Portunus trituberculatus]